MKKCYISPEIEILSQYPIMADTTVASVGATGTIDDGNGGGGFFDFGGDGNSGDDPDAKRNDGWDMWE